MKKDLNEKIFFASDYMEGAHPQIMQRLIDTNLVKTPGYGTDSYCESARNKIRTACSCPAGNTAPCTQTCPQTRTQAHRKTRPVDTAKAGTSRPRPAAGSTLKAGRKQ